HPIAWEGTSTTRAGQGRAICGKVRAGGHTAGGYDERGNRDGGQRERRLGVAIPPKAIARNASPLLRVFALHSAIFCAAAAPYACAGREEPRTAGRPRVQCKAKRRRRHRD